MRCAVNLTQASQPKWITSKLLMHPASSAKTLERKLVQIFSSPMSEIILAAPIPLPVPIFGEHAHLPAIKGVITHLNFQKNFTRIVIHDSTKEALGRIYLHFLRTWPMRCVTPSMKQSFQTRFINMLNTVYFELPCETIQCAIPGGRGDLPVHSESRIPHDKELEEMLASIVWRIRSLFFVGISADIPWSTIWDIPFIVPLAEITEYSQNSTSPNKASAKQKGERKRMKNSGQPEHHKKRLTSGTPGQSENTITIAPYHPMETRRKSSRPLSPISTSGKRSNRFRPANVSQNARGGKIRFPSVSYDSATNHENAKHTQPMEG